MLLKLAVHAGADVTPDSQTAIDAAHSAAAQRATAWTEPVFEHAEPQPDGTAILHYTVDAQPKTGIVTTDNIAPALLPPRVV